MVDDKLTLPADHSIQSSIAPNIISIHGNNHPNEPIMTIENDGKVIIHKSEAMGEAGEIFADSIRNALDNIAGFKQSRYDWEEDYMNALAEFAKNEPLTAEDIMTIFKERKVFEKLRGGENG